MCLTDLQEAALWDALSTQTRPYFNFALHTGLTIGKDKNGRTLAVPFNSTIEAVLLEMGTQRIRPSDPYEHVFPRRYREPDKFFRRAVKRAQEALRDGGRDEEAARLEGVSWHGLRHTWASRLTMNGVNPRTLQTLGGWRSLAMVERYSHLSPDHLRSAVEGLVAGQVRPASQPVRVSPPAAKLDSNLTRLQDEASRAS